jgi:PAS domain S-box-containing protein
MPTKKKTTSEKIDMTPVAAAIPLVVGIGASAGGLEALEHFFAVMPPDCGLSYVVLMHILPEGPALLPALLRRYTPMAVVTVVEGMPLAANTVHVLPGGWDLTLDDGRFKLTTAAPPHHPIDRFFASLARELTERAVAVVLSGAGTDGAAGVQKIREAGGLVLVQDPESALSPGMPRSAIATGAADFVLTADQLPEKIAEIARGTCALPPRTCRTNTLDEELQTICSIVSAVTSRDFSSYKANTVLRRIERRMAVHETGGFGKYIALLREDPLEAKALCQDILIGVTSFFRDPEAFEVLRQEVIPRLFAERDPDEPVRIWHACCSTGEEVYSTAMLIREYLDEQRLDVKVKLFATDIDEAAIARARAGLYSDDIAADVGEERLKRFFTRVDHRWQVAKALREMVVFAHHNLLKDPPFSRLDLLVCRNFLIYLNPDMQRRLIPLFHQVLKPGGVLFLGSAETVGRHSELFTAIDKKWKIFAHRERRGRGETAFPFTASIRRPPEIVRPSPPAGDEKRGPGTAAEKLLMKRYSPPCVVVNEKYEVVYVSTRMDRFLELPVGEPTRDILRMAREELRPPLRAAIYKAFAEEQEVVFRGVKVAIDDGKVTVNVQVEPLHAPPYGKLAMVVFAPAAPAAAMAAPIGAEEGSGDDTSRETLIRQLEEQLHITHEQLQAVTEQLESSNEGFMSANEELTSMNEEFQSANEELQSTNEELETSKEELQALNEELVTVNAELQGTVEELDQSNSDMENLLASSEIATIFLDRQLIIKRFSPAMAAIFNLIPADVGRPFRHLTGTIDWSGLQHDAAEVLEKLLPIEREVAALESGRHYLLRVLPYRSTNGIIDGIVVTLVDLTEHKRLEERTIHLASFPQLNPNPVLEVDSSGNVTFFNPATQKTMESLGKQGADAALFLPADLDDILESWDRKNEATLHREIKVGERTFGETIFLTPQFEAVRIYAFDITERKQAEEALRDSEQRVRRKLDSILSPEGEIGDLDLADIIDARPMQSLMDNFYKLTRMPMGMIDLKGKILVGVGWQDICTKFHRVHPETCKNCIESDTLLSADVPPGEFKLYKCQNNMWDVATPITVGGRKFGNFFMGQFLFEDEPVDYEFFRSQAKRYGFDEEEYLRCLESVPRLNKETLATGMAYFMELAEMLSRMSYSNLKLARSLAERDTLMASLRESEERFRSMFERHKAVMLLIEPESGAIVDANAAAAEFYDHSREELCGLKIQDFNQLSPEEVAAERQRAVEERRNHFVFPHRLATGEVRWVEVYSTPIASQGKSLLFSIIHDITERKRAEEELRESEQHNEFLANILEVTTQPFSVGYPDGHLGLFNHAYEELTGYSGEELLAIDWDEILTPAEWREIERDKLEELRRTGRPVRYEKEYRKKDGSRVPIELLVHLAIDPEGKPLYYYAFVTDISERKRAEEEIRQRVEELRASNEELTRFNDASVGRELRMIELKKEVNDLCNKAGQPPHYSVDFEE